MVGSTPEGDLLFRIDAPQACIAEVVCDFGPVAGVRVLAMKTGSQGIRWLRLPAGMVCVRYCFRIDGDVIRDPDAPSTSDQQAWRDLPMAA